MDSNFSASRVQESVEQMPLVLAVEDNEDNLLLIAYVLEQFNCTFMTATDGRKALSLAREYQPDLILLDMVLPEVSGIELISRFKQDKLTSRIPIIAVTGLVLAREREQIESAGCDDYISKPYLLNDLEAVIRRYLARLTFPALTPN